MQLACPKCGTREVRVSHRNGLLEGIKGVLGVYPLRCRRCRHRWLTSAWAGGAWKFARCPRCYRQELTTWSEQYYRPSRFTVMLLRMGATPYRCAACRCNFASFKPCKEKFSWRHETKSPVAGEEAGITPLPGHKSEPNGAGWHPDTAAESAEPELGSPAAVHAPIEPTPAEPVEDEASEPYL
jgi:hypothetical protein